jgi:DNA polymerase-1
MAWPRTDTGLLRLDRDTFRDMESRYPQVGPLMELRHMLSEMKLEELAVGPDARNRVLLSPYGAKTGRNTPSNTKFIFGPAVWLRGLIRPPEGRALAYIDWSSQEITIAAALSNDGALLEAVRSGDPYMMFARMAGLAPPDATKTTHPHVREMCKTCMLGISYGMGAGLLAIRTGLTGHQTADLLQRVRRTFPGFSDWSDASVSRADLQGYQSTVLGWTLRTAPHQRATSQRNFPVQANANEMLRLACSFTTERGVRVCCPVHDALLIEADADRIGDAIATTQSAMTEASEIVLRGLGIGTDVDVIPWPRRYADKRERARVVWGRVMRILDALE